MQRFDLFKRFRKDERGVFAVFFALIAIVLIAASGAVVDFTRVQQARTRAQIALDSAALALQSKVGVTGYDAAWFKSQSQALLTERIADSSVTAVVSAATPDVTAGKLTISGYISVPTYFVQLVGIKDIRSQMLSEVTRSSNDLEVALSIDVTGSMARVTCGRFQLNCTPSDKIGDLIKASNTLIELLVKDNQTPTYSKMAIVPWSYSVNLGALAPQVRGTPTAGVAISALTWASGSSLTINAITQANPVRVQTTTNHSLSVGDYVYITGVVGMTNLNNNIYRVGTVPTTTRVTLQSTGGANINSSTWTAFSNTGSPRITKCQVANCLEVVTTSGAHGISAGESVLITGTVGTSGINDTVWTPSILTSTTYSLPGTDPTDGIRTSGGTSYCVKYGCSYYWFTNAAGGQNLWQPNNCVTDRTTNPFTDTAPSTSPFKFHYTSGGADCIDNQIVPLTANKTTLHAAIGPDSPISSRTLDAVGSTAGHIGLAWGWYMISPNFASLWPSSAPAPKAYGSTNLVKAVIFMTDGVFNTPYCNGVTANDALSGSPGTSLRINCASQNGSSKAQAQSLCNAIKATSTATSTTHLYVVGFDLADDADSLAFLQGCATDIQHFYRADTGADLQAAFAAIAQNLSDLRISR